MKTKDTSVKTTITVNIEGQSFDLTLAQAKKLKQQLEEAIPDVPQQIFVPVPYPKPEPVPYRPRRPWGDGPYWRDDNFLRDTPTNIQYSGTGIAPGMALMEMTR